ncbi:hypothetical protein ACF0H2_03095 [Serratia marcescens]
MALSINTVFVAITAKGTTIVTTIVAVSGIPCGIKTGPTKNTTDYGTHNSA